MTPTSARNTVESILREHFTDPFWYVVAKRERRCCCDRTCAKPRHELGGKILVRIFPWALNQQNYDLLPEVERALSQHLDGVAKTTITLESGAAKQLRPAVRVWLD